MCWLVSSIGEGWCRRTKTSAGDGQSLLKTVYSSFVNLLGKFRLLYVFLLVDTLLVFLAVDVLSLSFFGCILELNDVDNRLDNESNKIKLLDGFQT